MGDDALLDQQRLERADARGGRRLVAAGDRRVVVVVVVVAHCASWSQCSKTSTIEPVVGVAAVVGPHVALGEGHEVQRLLGEPVAAVRARLGVAEGGVDPLDGAGLALEVRRRAVMALVLAGVDPHALARPVAHGASRASSSPGATTPSSASRVSIENSQRS